MSGESVVDDIVHTRQGYDFIQPRERENGFIALKTLSEYHPEGDMDDNRQNDGSNLAKVAVVGDGEDHSQRGKDKERDEGDDGSHCAASFLLSLKLKGDFRPKTKLGES